MKVWPLEQKPFLEGSTVVLFETERYDGRKKDIVVTLHVASPELVLHHIEKTIRNFHTVILKDQETGEKVGFDRDENGTKYCYPGYGTDKQDKIEIERFPWEAG